MTPKLKATSPLFKKCALDTLTFHLNPFRATFLLKKAPTKNQNPKTLKPKTENTTAVPWPREPTSACWNG